MAPKKKCFDFAEKGFCKYKNCRYSHDISENSQHTEPLSSKSKSPQGKNDGKNDNNMSKFLSWRSDIPSGFNVRPLRARLARFFTEAKELIKINDDILQEVIRLLAQEGGLRRIQELIEREFSHLSTETAQVIYRDQVLPFLRIITDKRVLLSLVLEQAVGTIYNCIYGQAGHRGGPFIDFLTSAVSFEVESGSEGAFIHLKLSLHVFSQLVELNSTALVHEPFKPLVKKFEKLFLSVRDAQPNNPLEGAHKYLVRLQRRFEIGSSLPPLYPTSTIAKEHRPGAKFVHDRDPPGGRHNNDHSDIRQIRIMPTVEEILCSRSEYLPVRDPKEWHLGGLSGLLDMNFRLLREDTVGQLRDAVHAELKGDWRREKSHLRTNIYWPVQISRLTLQSRAGFQFLVDFPQPFAVEQMSKTKRKEWWQLSKRLQHGALVCLTHKQESVVFCTVGYSRLQSNPESNGKEDQEDEPLWANPNSATLTLELAEATEENLNTVLMYYFSKTDSTALSIVEFPGVLLPSFKPTLLALQYMQNTADIAISEFIAPQDPYSSGKMEVPRPAYTMSPGFKFELSCITKDGSSLEIDPMQPGDLGDLKRNSALDDAQTEALVSALQRRLALIQGPPGTGKSYTGIALIKVLLHNKGRVKSGLGPILCVCYTNHALDQLLEELLEKKITTQIVRIGSQSKSQILQPLNLQNVSRLAQRTRLEWRKQVEVHQILEKSATQFSSMELDKEGSDKSLESYLRWYEPMRYDEFFAADEEGFKIATAQNPRGHIRRWAKTGPTGKEPPRNLGELENVSVYDMTLAEREMLYESWVTGCRENVPAQVRSLWFAHTEAKASMNQIRAEMDLRCLRNADVVGVTTTGLARNLEMLRSLTSKVVVCEEAGEVLEAHLLTTLIPSIEHVILIGDHLQLRPQIQNYELSRESKTGKQYSLDLSLFERLVQPDAEFGVQVPFCSLETQRRMHPSIAQLVRDTLYPQLKDGLSVLDYPEVKGIRKRLFWLDHQRPEASEADQDAMVTSHWNKHEIDLTVALASHLLRQGEYQGGEVAILTPYLGQLHRLRNRLRKSFTILMGQRDQDDLDAGGFTDDAEAVSSPPVAQSNLLQTLRVATIDNFQGEEAKVVIISLVRSNSRSQCGFLRTPNRINVLLSRAKHGMYIIGNSKTSEHVEMWKRVIEILSSNGNIGMSLELKCPRHPDTPIKVTEPEDFVQFSPEGGCGLICDKRLSCGHPCKQKCHSKPLHLAVYCLEPCTRPRKGCEHICPKFCGDPCPKLCTVPVTDETRVLSCGHLVPTLPCWQAQDLSTVKCQYPVKKLVQHCNHEVAVPCHVDVNDSKYDCQTLCQKILPCAHSCRRKCCDCIVLTEAALEVDHGKCTQKCGRLYTTCAHSCQTECHEGPCPPCEASCDVECAHSRCPRKCSDPCAPCAQPKCTSECPHSSCTMPCAAPCDHIPCSLRCSKILDCGHRCPSVCGEICPTTAFCQICAADEIKSRVVDFIAGETFTEIDLDVNPCIFPKCGHFLTIESMDGQMGLGEHYEMSEMGKPLAIASSSRPFSVEDIKVCAECRGSLRNIPRYGRLVRRALLDEATKKHILYVNQQYIPLAQDLPQELARLQMHKDTAKVTFIEASKITIEGSRSRQIRIMSSRIEKHDGSRWKGLVALRKRMTAYQKRVEVTEQPFNRVRDMVETARRQKITTGKFEFDETVLETKGYLQISALILRLDIALLADFVSLRGKVSRRVNKCELCLDLKPNYEACEELISKAALSSRFLQQAEGFLFRAQLYAIERRDLTDPVLAEALLNEAKTAISQAKSLSETYPHQTRGLMEEIEGTEKMLQSDTFYTPITSEERLEVMKAMASEFLGTGHWYYCALGHPFTIGECGMPMEQARCPECNSPVGGRNHESVEGVTTASDMEESFSNMNLGN